MIIYSMEVADAVVAALVVVCLTYVVHIMVRHGYEVRVWCKTPDGAEFSIGGNP